MQRNRFSFRQALAIVACVSALLFSFPVFAFAAKVSYVPTTVTQPDGSTLHLFMSGDEFFNYAHTANGSIVRENAQGFYAYCVERFDNVLEPGTLRVDHNPLFDGLKAQDVDVQANVQSQDMMDHIIASSKPKFSTSGKRLATGTTTESSPSYATGDVVLTKSNLTNVVCYIRFSGEAEFAPNEEATDQTLLNTGTYSLNNYIKAQSENSCSFASVMPKGSSSVAVSYCATQPRGYYQPYNATTNPIGYQTDTDSATREHTLLKEAVAWMNAMSDIPLGSTLDRNNDGYVDSIMFIVNGDAGEWASLLWPHQWDMGTTVATLSGKTVGNYSFELQNFSPSRKLSTYAHESMHVLGFPDLYRYYAAGDPIGCWDIMNQDQPIPQYANAYMRKTVADWGPAIATAKVGTNVVRAPSAAGTEPLCLALPITTQQAFVFEYRKNAAGTFDQDLPSSGLLPYRVLTVPQANAYGNMYGPNYYPDGYYIFRPGVTAWGSIPWYDSAGYGLGSSMGGGTPMETWTLSSSNGRSTYGSPGVPADSLFAYGGAQVQYYIGDVGVNTGDTISFKLNTINDFNNYVVDFNTGGGTPVASQSIFAGQTSTEPTVAPTRSGYTFKGWFTSATATTTFDFANTAITKNMTVYAQWDQLPVSPSSISVDTTPTAKVDITQPFTLVGRVIKTSDGALNISGRNAELGTSGPLSAGEMGTGIEGATVYLQTSTDGGKTWATDSAITDVTDATGVYSLTYYPETSMLARAYAPAQVAGSTSIDAMTSSSVNVTVMKEGMPVPASNKFTLFLVVVCALAASGYAVRRRAMV